MAWERAQYGDNELQAKLIIFPIVTDIALNVPYYLEWIRIRNTLLICIGTVRDACYLK